MESITITIYPGDRSIYEPIFEEAFEIGETILYSRAWGYGEYKRGIIEDRKYDGWRFIGRAWVYKIDGKWRDQDMYSFMRPPKDILYGVCEKM